MNINVPAKNLKSFSNYGIAAFVLCGLFIAIFGVASTNSPAQTRVFLVAESFNIYFALAIWAGQRQFRHFGVAVLIALIPCALSLFFKFQYLLIILLVAYLFYFIRNVKNSKLGFNIGIAVLILIVGGGYAFIVLGTNELTDIFFKSKMLVGQFNTDSFFHMAIASMLEHYGQASIGAHGIVPISYYTFSHYFFAALAYAGGISVVDSYAAIYSIVLIPLLFLSLSQVAEDIFESRSSSEYIFRLFLIGLFFAGFLGYGPGSISNHYAMWVSFFESESYTLSLILLLAIFSLLHIESFLAQSVAISVCLLLLCVTKASTAIVAYGICVGYLIFFNRRVYLRRLAAFVLITLSILIGLKSVASTAPELMQVHYFDFVKSYVLGESSNITAKSSLNDFQFWIVLIKFSAVHFFFSWACYFLALNAMIFPSAARSVSGKAVIYNFIALSAGFIAVIFMALPAGAVYYFSNISMFVALPFVVVYMGAAYSMVSIRKTLSGSAIVPVIFLCFGCLQLVPQTLRFSRAIIGKSSHVPPTAGNVLFAGYLRQLESIRNLPEAKNMLIYVAKENADFWEASTTASCMAQSFAIVAISEHPAVYGLPDKARCDTVFYGFNSYSDDLFALSARDRIGETELLAETKRLGFDGYVDITKTAWQIHRVH